MFVTEKIPRLFLLFLFTLRSASTMAKSKLLHPQFFHTLVHGFHTHLTIPLDFFSKYIQGKSVEKKKTAELKSDSSEVTWKVKVTGRRLSDGWKEFAFDHDLQIGHVVLFRYEGDLVFHVSDLGPNNDDGKILLNKRLNSRTDVGDDDDEELPIKKKVKKNSHETEPERNEDESSMKKPKVLSFSSYSPSHKRLVTFTLPPNYVTIRRLTLPKPFLKENGINKPGEISLLGKGGAKWPTNLLLDKKGTMSLGSGWKDFVKANGLETGFTVKLIWKGTTPMLSLCCDRDKISKDENDKDCPEASSEEESIEGESSEGECSSTEMEKEKHRPKPKRRVLSYSSYSPSHKKSLTFTLPPGYDRIGRLSLPVPFLKENGINKPGEMYLLGKNGLKWPTSLLLDKNGTMSLGKGWKEFVKGNGLATSFMVKLMWEGTTRVFSLCSEESASDSEEEEEISRTIKKQSTTTLVTITNRPNIRLRLPKQFVVENGMDKPGTVYLLGEDGKKWKTNLVRESDGRTNLGSGWKVFAEANNVKRGESFTLESTLEDETPMIRFIRTEPNSSKANKKESISAGETEPRTRDSSSAIQERFVTLTLTPEDVKACMLYLPSQFMKANGINKPGKITILGENKTEWWGYLLLRHGIVALDYGWDGFCEANGVKLGEPFSLEFISKKDTVTVLKFCSL